MRRGLGKVMGETGVGQFAVRLGRGGGGKAYTPATEVLSNFSAVVAPYACQDGTEWTVI